jgi:hypothetical protein
MTTTKGPKPFTHGAATSAPPSRPSGPAVAVAPHSGGGVGIGSHGTGPITNAGKKKPKRGKPNVPPKGSQFALRKEGRPNVAPRGVR